MEDRDMTDSTELKKPPTFKERDKWICALLAAELPHATARIAVAIAMHLNVDSGRCIPGYPTLAHASSVPERSVYRHVELLERAGWIEIERATGCVSQFYLRTPANSMAVVPEPTPANSMAGVPLPNRADTPAKSSTNPCHTVADIKRRTAKRTAKTLSRASARETRPSGSSSSDQGGDGFEDWYRNYPKHVAKGAALKAYQRIIKTGEASAADLLNGCMRYAAERDGQDPKYTKHPATWLNQKCWLDESAAPAAPSAGNGACVGWASVLKGLASVPDDGSPRR
jgi:hypothetical protein